MFISRKTLKLASLKNKISNSQLEAQSIDHIRKSHSKITHSDLRNTHNGGAGGVRPDAEVVRYPVFNYLLGVFLTVCFIYLIYSVHGGSNSLPGFNQRLWWQYLLATVPLLIAILLLIFSTVESVIIGKEAIRFEKSRLIGFYIWEEKERELSELVNISILKKGVERVTFTNVSFVLIFNFRAFEEIEALECGSQISAGEYLQQLKAAVPSLRQSQRRITMKTVIQT